MHLKRNFGTPTTAILAIALLICFLSCGDIDPEPTDEQLRFAEFFFFPTAPYIDKSYVEKISEEELASKQIDFEVEKQAIQEVYSNFHKAFMEEDMKALTKTLDIRQGIEYGTTTGIVYGWNDIKIYIEANWEKSDCRDDPNWVATDFYIRPKNIQSPWMEASVTGITFYYDPGSHTCYVGLAQFYFTKRSGKWRIHQINGTKYFSDDKYFAP